ncbi:hypothetical protein V6Z88_006153 [Aspergillus fumigatus]
MPVPTEILCDSNFIEEYHRFMEFRKPAFPATGSLLTRSTSHCNLASSSLRGTAFAKTMIHSYLQLGELHDTVDSLNLRPCVEHQYATLYPLAASSPLSFLLAHCDGFISLSLLYLSPTFLNFRARYPA